MRCIALLFSLYCGAENSRRERKRSAEFCSDPYRPGSRKHDCKFDKVEREVTIVREQVRRHGAEHPIHLLRVVLLAVAHLRHVDVLLDGVGPARLHNA